MDFHPAANIFPLMDGEEYRALVEDIRANGLREPIIIDTKSGTILDGRNRRRACLDANVLPDYVPYDGDDPVGYVISLNLHRRHLSESQRSMVSARVANLVEGRPSNTAHKCAVSQAQAADMLNISRRSVQNAQAVINRGTPALVQAVESGRIPVTAAAALTELPAEKQERLVTLVDSGQAKSIVDAKRIVRHEEVKPPAALSDKYRVIYADPPWSYGNSGIINNDNYGHAERHYSTMSIDELCELPVKDLAEDNAVLFLWVTSPMLSSAFPLISAWGFTYKTSFVWDKIKHNFGHYNSVRHELLLICTRGSCTPDSSELVDSVVSLERTDKHSEKPEYFRELIDKLYTHGKRIELFARERHDGWESWGNEL